MSATARLICRTTRFGSTARGRWSPAPGGASAAPWPWRWPPPGPNWRWSAGPRANSTWSPHEIAQAGGRARALPLDVTDSAAVREAFAGLGALDILVNNAGLNRPQPFLDVDEDTLDRLLDLNVRAAFLVAQAAARLMVASTGAKAGGGRHHQHVVADGPCRLRARPHRLCHDQARDRRADQGDGGRVGAQGRARRLDRATFIDTPLVRPFFADPTFRQWVLDRIPLGRLGTVEEVASAVVFLASPAASLVTGSSLLVDGGWTAW